MSQAIETSSKCDRNGNRHVTAKAYAGKVRLAWDNSLSGEANHLVAASTLATKLGWCGHWVGGDNARPDSGMVFVCVDGAAPSFEVQS